MAKEQILRTPDSSAHDDDALVARVLSGDRWAKEMLFRRHVDKLGTLVIHLLRDRADAEDVVQDTFIAAFEDLPKLRDPAVFRSWLTRIAVRKVHRRFRRRRLLRALGLDRSADAIDLESLASNEATGEMRAELALLDRRLHDLPVTERIAWTLRRVEGASIREVADACDCSASTAKRRIRAADDRLGFEARDGGAS